MAKPKLQSKSKQPIFAFWDSSAIVPLCCGQPQTVKARQAYRLFPKIVVWWSASVECTSAFYRLERNKELAALDVQHALRSLETHRRLWDEVAPSEEVRTLAEGLLKKHQLRAADSLQLAAALVWCNSLPKGRAFVCDDGRLLAAAEKEGFNAVYV